MPLNAKGLLVPEEDDIQQGQIPGGDPNASSGQVTSGLALQTDPKLAGGQAGVQRLDYGGGIANAGKQYAWNAKWAPVEQQIQRQIANAAFDRTNTYNSLNSAWQQARDESSRLNDLAQKQMSQSLASRGQGFSGEKLNETGRLQGDWLRYNNQIQGQYTGGINAAENLYGRTLGELAGQRETNYAAQTEEERVARVERERQAAEAKARADDAARQQALQQQYINSLNQQNAQNAWYQQQQIAHANGIGAELADRLNGLFTGVSGDTTADQLFSAMSGITDLDWLTQFYGRGLPEPLNSRVRKMIVGMNTPASPTYVAQPVGHNDQPYGFNQGGMAL
jgi:hypothetical protein